MSKTKEATRFDLSTHQGRQDFRQWLRPVLSESFATWDDPEVLTDLSFEEYFEPELWEGTLYNSPDALHDAIVEDTERARKIYRDVRDQLAENR